MNTDIMSVAAGAVGLDHQAARRGRPHAMPLMTSTRPSCSSIGFCPRALRANICPLRAATAFSYIATAALIMSKCRESCKLRARRLRVSIRHAMMGSIQEACTVGFPGFSRAPRSFTLTSVSTSWSDANVRSCLRLQLTNRHAFSSDPCGQPSPATLLTGWMRCATTGKRNSRVTMNSFSVESPTINLFNLNFGVQSPDVALPVGVDCNSEPQRLQLTEEQINNFDEDGFILIPGAMRQWVDFLQKVADHQVCHPHILAVSASLREGYQYIQINTWMTNDGFRDFFYFSPLGHVLAQLGDTDEVRITTDNLLVNPHRCFGWHQDNQTGPIDPDGALRFWVPMDACTPGAGAPEYLLGSHKNTAAARDTCYVNVDGSTEGSPQRFARPQVQPGDLLIWHACTIHRLVVPEGRPFTRTGLQRRVISGTAVKRGALYWGRSLSGVMGDASAHDLKDGEILSGPYFPRIFPYPLEQERRARAEGKLIPRSPLKVFERKLQAQWQAFSADLSKGIQS